MQFRPFVYDAMNQQVPVAIEPMTPQDAANYGVHDGQIVDITVEGPSGGTYANVAIRANDASALECHVDTEEANAMSINSLSKIKIKK